MASRKNEPMSAIRTWVRFCRRRMCYRMVYVQFLMLLLSLTNRPRGAWFIEA